MAFADTFAHDVFISYAQVDNEPLLPGNNNSKWVRTMRTYLQTFLDQKLGRRGAASIWMDLSGIQGNEPLNADISESITGSAILVAVVSEGYLSSPWCAEERKLFLENAGGMEGAGKRIFLIRRDDIPQNDPRWPSEFGQLLGYPFYETDPETRLVRTLGVPIPDPDEKDYYIRLDRLRTDLAGQLKAMKAGGGASAGSGGASPAAANRAAAPTATAPVTPTATAPVTPTSASDRKAICLAEVTPDLMESRESVKRYLEQQGWEVLPGQYYPREPASFRAAMEKDLAHSLLFVQMLGPWWTPRTDGLQAGYEGLQLEAANAAGIEILRWRSRELDVEAISEDLHRECVGAADVVATDLEEFKDLVAGEARSIHSRQSVDVSPGGGKFVLLKVDPGDVEVADRIAAKLGAMDLGFDIVDEDIPLSDLTESDDYDGLIVIYGSCPQDWVQARVRECRRVALRKKARAPICAVLVGPPNGKEPLRTRPPRFHIIESEDDVRFQAFLEALAAKEQAA